MKKLNLGAIITQQFHLGDSRDFIEGYLYAHYKLDSIKSREWHKLVDYLYKLFNDKED